MRGQTYLTNIIIYNVPIRQSLVTSCWICATLHFHLLCISAWCHSFFLISMIFGSRMSGISSNHFTVQSGTSKRWITWLLVAYLACLHIVFTYNLMMIYCKNVVGQELSTLPQHLSSTPVFSGIRCWLFLFSLYVLYCLSMSFCSFPFGNCIVWLILFVLKILVWYLETDMTGHISETKIDFFIV